MALTRVSRHIIDDPFNPTAVSATDVTTTNINASGIGTVGTLRVTGDLTVEGTTTTLDSILTEVDRLEVSANSTVAAGIITQTGSGDILNLFDGSTEVFTVTDGGKVGIEAPNPSGNLNISYLQVGKGQVSSDHSLYNYNTSFTNNAYQNGNGTFAHITSRAVGVINIQDNVFKFLNGPGGTAGQSATLTERFTISSGGNIGLAGQTNPADSLHIGDFATVGYELKLSRNALQFKRAGNSFIDQKDDAGHILFRTTSNNLTRLRINNDGTIKLPNDNQKLTIGSSEDLEIYHDATDSFISNSGPGQLYIKTETNDRDVIIQSDNGSGGLANYVKCDGSTGAVELSHYGSLKLSTAAGGVNIAGNLNLNSADNYEIRLGASNDLKLYHNGTHSYIDNVTNGALIIRNTSNDVDVVIESDDGSGGLANYFRADGSTGDAILYHYGSQRLHTNSTGINVVGVITADGLDMNDSEKILLGTGDDLEIFHNGGQVNESFVDNKTGNLNIRNFADDKDITIQSDNGSGGLANYIFCDGSSGRVVLSHYGSGKIETSSTGAKVTGALEVTQEYPSIRPTLDLNFAATKTLDRRITFTRDSVGTYVDENGLVKYASNNVPRFDHDPATGESLGLLIEESRTNLFTYSENFDSWGTAYRTTISLNVAISPSGQLNASKFNVTTDTGYHARSFSITGGTYTVSIFAKAGEYNGIQITGSNTNQDHACFNLVNGTAYHSGTNVTNIKIENYGNGWYRCSARLPLTNGNLFVAITDGTTTSWLPSFAGSSATDGIYIWGAQVEAGSFATSYIPTSGSTATRSADFAAIRRTNFTDFYNSEEGTIYCEFTHGVRPWHFCDADISQSQRFFGFSNDSGGIRVGRNAGGWTYISAPTTGSYSRGDDIKSAVSYGPTSFSVGAFGQVTDSGTTNANTGIDRLLFYQDTSNPDTNGTIRALKYYNKRLPNAQLQGLTQQ